MRRGAQPAIELSWIDVPLVKLPPRENRKG